MSKVYTDKPATIEKSKANMTRVIAFEMFERVIENWNYRMNHVDRSDGQYLKHMILKRKYHVLVIILSIAR